MKQKSLDKNKLLKSFKYAFNGIILCIKKEQNMYIHFLFSIVVITLGFLLSISPTEWLFCTLAIGLVFASELINTSIENLCNLVTTKENNLVKIAKDTAAGAVLVLAITAIVIGLIIFLPKI